MSSWLPPTTVRSAPRPRANARDGPGGTEGGCETRNRRARPDAHNGSRDPGRAQEQKASRGSSVREESEGDRPQAIEAESRGRQQAQGHVVRAELQLPSQKENGDRQDVRMDHAVEESEDGHDAPILPPHPWPHRSGGIRTSAVTHGESRGPLLESRGPRSRRSRRAAKAREGETHDEKREGGSWSFGYRSARAEPVPRNDYPMGTEGRTGTRSRLVVLRLVVGCPGLRFGLIVFDRLLDDLP